MRWQLGALLNLTTPTFKDGYEAQIDSAHKIQFDEIPLWILKHMILFNQMSGLHELEVHDVSGVVATSRESE